MRILLDENLPDSLIEALETLGHEVDSVNTLRLKGIDNGTLYKEVAQAYDLCFTKDTGFVHNVRQEGGVATTKLLRVTLQQQPAKPFSDAFITAFQSTDWAQYENGADWPYPAFV